MSRVNKFNIAVASPFTAVSLFSQVYLCRHGLIGRLTVNRHVISFFHSPVFLHAVLAFHSVNRCDLYFFQCFLSVYTQYLWPISTIRPISPMQYFYGPITR